MDPLQTPAAYDDIPRVLARLGGDLGSPALSFYRGKSLDGRLSYGDLLAHVEKLAAELHHRQGIGRGTRVAVLSPNRLEIPVLIIALMRLGALVVPLNPTASPDDWSYILRHSRARALAVTHDLGHQVPEAARPEITLFVEALFHEGTALPPAPDYEQLGEQPAVVLYTSGTTGNPKGVTLRQRNLVWNAWSMAQNFGLRKATQLAVLPLYHAHAFGFGLMSALVTRGHLVFTERLEPFSWMEVLRAESVQVTSVVPSLLPMLLAARVSRAKVPELRHILVSSAPLAVDVAREFEEKTQIPLIQGWGLSEYTNFACCMPVGVPYEEHSRFLFGWEVPSIGPTLDGTEVRVVDANGAPVPDGVRGELLYRGHSQMLGYLDDEAATRRAIDAEGWLATGDQGFAREHGGRSIFFITGRLKEIIIRDAEKYSPLALEQRLIHRVPEMSGKLVVLRFPHRVHGEEVGAYVELASLDDTLEQRLRSAIDAMPVAERPKVALHGTNPIPRTHTGKIQRRKMQPWFDRYMDHRGVLVICGA